VTGQKAAMMDAAEKVGTCVNLHCSKNARLGFLHCNDCLSKLPNQVVERCDTCNKEADTLDGRCIHCWREAAIHNRNLVLSIP